MIVPLLRIDIEGRNIRFREPSFFEYKSICKMLLDSDFKNIDDNFNYILDDLIKTDISLNIIEKFKCLLDIRGVVLGNEINFLFKNKKTIIQLQSIVDQIPNNKEYTTNEFIFKSPTSFYHSDIQEYVTDCFTGWRCYDAKDLSFEEKLSILGSTELPLTEIYRNLIEMVEDTSIKILNDVSINIFDYESVLYFLKNIFAEDLNDIIQFEYICMRDLDLRAKDFKTYTYPELKIFLNHLHKDRKDAEKEGGTS